MSRRKGLRVFAIIIAVIIGAFSTAYVASGDVRYLTRAGLEEFEILKSRQSIDKLLASDKTDVETRRSLEIVLAARDYAAGLGLDAKQTYTTYADIGRDTLLLVLSAAPKDCLCPYTWKFPIVGRIPYKGFFDPRMAEKEAGKLEGKGYDTYLRPAGAFSTLGWFNDPLLSTAMSRDSMELAALVFHEIAHNTLYVKSATPFNESFAQLVGYRAAEDFFRSRGDTVTARRAADRWLDEVILAGYYDSLATRLKAFYDTKPSPAVLDSGRTAEAAWAREYLAGPVAAELKTYTVTRLAERPINNARLIAATIYRQHLDLFERWYELQGGDISKTVAQLEVLMEGAEGDSAFARLERAVGE